MNTSFDKESFHLSNELCLIIPSRSAQKLKHFERDQKFHKLHQIQPKVPKKEANQSNSVDY